MLTKEQLIEIITRETNPDHDHWNGWFVAGIEEAADAILKEAIDQTA